MIKDLTIKRGGSGSSNADLKKKAHMHSALNRINVN